MTLRCWYKNMAVEKQELTPFTEDEFEHTRLVDFKFVLTLQMNDCRKVLNMPITPEATAALVECVNTFDSLLKDFRDDKYRKFMYQLEISHDAHWNKLSQTEKDINHHMLKKHFYRNKYEALIALATRQGLTVMKDVAVRIK